MEFLRSVNPESVLLGARKLAGNTLRRYRMATRRRLPHFERALAQQFESMRGYAMSPAWWEFASTSLVRGQRVARRIRRHTSIEGKRCLDIGCAYGGFPVAFARLGARAAVGIELDPKLLALAGEMVKDVPCSAEFRPGDAMDRDFISSLGTFDIVTCNDVIEHVADPFRLLEHCDLLLRPGGLLFLEIPNRRCVEAVLEDGHYGMFGLTLLDRPRAIRYYEQFYTAPYGVGEYLDLSQYLDALEQRGISGRCLERLDLPRTWIIRSRRRAIGRLAGEYEDRVRRLPLRDPATSQDLLEVLAEYVEDHGRMDREYQAAKDRGQRDRLARRLVSTYHTSMWQVVGNKPEG